MPSTFTQNTGIEKPGDGEQAGLWGDTVNLSSDIIDRALNGSTSIALTSTSYTLTTAGGTLSEGQYAAVTFTGTPGGTATVTVAPSTAQKTYFIRNSTDQSVVITQGSGGNATIAAGRSAVVVCTGVGASSAVFDVTAVMNTATSANTANAVVQRDGSGGFSAGAITATSGTVGGAAITTASNTQTLTNKTLTSPDVNGGTVDGAVIGGTTPAAISGTTGTFSGTVSAADLSLGGTAVTATAAELNILDGVTATTAELNYTGGVTSNIQTQLNGKAATATTISAGAGLTGGGSLAANRTISHADTSSQGSVNNSGATVIQGVTLDTYGHVTALGSTTLSLGTFGVTSTAAELNKLDGFTGVVADLNYAKDLRATGVTTAEFDKLDGLTATTAELNYTDGVTSNIQTQLNGKASTASHATSVWEAGTNTTATIVSPANVRAAVESRAIGDGQQWYNDGAIASGTVYQNTTGRSIQVMVSFNGSGAKTIGFSTNGTTWIETLNLDNDGDDSDANASFIVPAGHRWRVVGAWTVSRRNVLR